MERCHPTVKKIRLLTYEKPTALTEAVGSFVEYYNRQRYHERQGNVTTYDAYTGRRGTILQRREEKEQRTLEIRKGISVARSRPTRVFAGKRANCPDFGEDIQLACRCLPYQQ